MARTLFIPDSAPATVPTTVPTPSPAPTRAPTSASWEATFRRKLMAQPGVAAICWSGTGFSVWIAVTGFEYVADASRLATTLCKARQRRVRCCTLADVLILHRAAEECARVAAARTPEERAAHREWREAQPLSVRREWPHFPPVELVLLARDLLGPDKTAPEVLA